MPQFAPNVNRLWSPLNYFLVVLVIVFVAELGVMFALPLLLPPDADAYVEAVCDASILTVVVAPLVWSVLIQPLRAVATAKSHRYASLFSDAHDAIITLDRQGHITAANPSALRLLGFDVPEIVGESLRRFMPDFLSTDNLALHFQHCVGKGHECSVITRDGCRTPVDFTVSSSSHGGTTQYTLILRDVTDRKVADEQNDIVQKQRVESARFAGKAEIATSVLHNVGNTLTCINVLSGKIADDTRRLRISGLKKVVDLLDSHQDNLGEYLSSDERGKQIPKYLATLADGLEDEQCNLLCELESLSDYLKHANRIVSAQQEFARSRGLEEETNVSEVIDHAFEIASASLVRHKVRFEKNIDDVPMISVDRHKLIQILVNLITNAKDAVKEREVDERRIVVKAYCSEHGRLMIEVSDNGVGIDAFCLNNLFTQGFTTKSDGHGFGLHYCATTAMEMGGLVTASSQGKGLGATFVLELPFSEVTVGASS